MNHRMQSSAFAVLALALLLATAASAAPRETIAPAFKQAVPNIPGKSLVAAVVSYPPGGKTPSHRHAGSGFVAGYVPSGSIRSQVEGEPVRIFHAGESWSEQPGAHHLVSGNASRTKPAKLLAIFRHVERDALAFRGEVRPATAGAISRHVVTKGTAPSAIM